MNTPVEFGTANVCRPLWVTADQFEVAESAPASERVPEKADARKPRILVVDDIDTNLEIVESYLRDSGYHVHSVSSGFDAIQLLSRTHFDLILMDVQMPVMDGVTTTRHIRALPIPTGNIPIIAMTGHVFPQQVKSFLASGMNDHVGKPFDRIKLCKNVQRWLARSDKRRVGAALSSSDMGDHFAPAVPPFDMPKATVNATGVD